MNLLAALKLNPKVVERDEKDEKGDNVAGSQIASKKLDENGKEKEFGLTMDDICGDGKTLPQILVLLVDRSLSMKGERIKQVRKFIQNQVHQSKKVVLYAMDVRCHKLTKCMTSEEFIKMAESSQDDVSNTVALWKQVGHAFEKYIAPCSDCPEGGIQLMTNVEPVSKKLTKNNVIDYSHDFEISLNNFDCGSWTDICPCLGSIFNEIMDLINDEHGYNIYFLFATDAEDDKVSNEQIRSLKESLDKVKKLARMKNITFINEIYVIKNNNATYNKNKNNQFKQLQASATALLNQLFEGTIDISDKSVANRLNQESRLNQEMFDNMRGTIRNDLGRIRKTFNDKLKSILAIGQRREQTEKIVCELKKKFEKNCKKVESIKTETAQLNGEYEAMKSICNNPNTMSQDEKDMTQLKILDLNGKFIQAHDKMVVERKTIETETNILKKEEKSLTDEIKNKENDIKIAQKCEQEIEDIKKKMYPVNNGKCGRDQVINWFREKLQFVRQKIIKLLKHAGTEVSQAWKMVAEVTLLSFKYKISSDNLQEIETELRNKIQELEKLLQQLEQDDQAAQAAQAAQA